MKLNSKAEISPMIYYILIGLLVLLVLFFLTKDWFITSSNISQLPVNIGPSLT